MKTNAGSFAVPTPVPTRAPAPPAPSAPPSRAPWLVPAGLVLLSLLPSVLGALRLAGFALDRATLEGHARLAAHAGAVSVHGASAMLFALLGAFQFAAPLLRRARSAFHVAAGRVLAPAGALAAASGIWLAVTLPPAEDAVPLLGLARVLAGGATLVCLARGLLALARRDYPAHGAWFTRAYALVVAAGTQALTTLPYVTLVPLEARSTRVVQGLLVVGWVVNAAVAEVVIRRGRRARGRRAGEGSAAAVAVVAGLVALAVPTAARADADAAAPTAARADETAPTGAGGARAAHLLEVAAEAAHDRRVLDGVSALATGTTLLGAGVASWVTPSEPDARSARDVVGGVFVGVGSVLVLGSTWSLAAPTNLERLHTVYGPTLRAGGPSADEAARVVALELDERASTARTERHVTAVTSFVAGAAMAAGGIALELEADDHGLVWLGRGLLAASAGSVAIGVGELVVRSEDERLASLFRDERALSGARASSGVRLVPRLGLGTVGLTGTF